MASQLPPKRFREPLIPISVAGELISLLLALRSRWMHYPLDDVRVLNIAPSDIEHCLDLAQYCGKQLPAERWECVVDELRLVVSELDSRSISA